MVGSQLIQLRRALHILLDADAVLIADAQRALAIGILLLGSEGVHLRGLFLVLFHAAPGLIAQPEEELRAGILLLRRCLKQRKGALVVARGPRAAAAEHAEVTLSHRASELRRALIERDGLPQILLYAAPRLIAEPQ